MSKHYDASGVHLEAGYESVELIKPHVKRTFNQGVMSNIGSFGGLFDLAKYNIKDPVLVSGTDGVGTKLKVAFMCDKHDTIGIDAVAMCVNDILAQGAQPLFFLDYLAVAKNHPQKIADIVKGVADGCVLADCALIGGETAEMPDVYADDEYDIAGFAVGVAERSELISSLNVKAGDVLIGLASSGLHSNGYSLVRKILFKDHKIELNTAVGEKTLEEWLLTPTEIYVRSVIQLMKKVKVHGCAHITGGGFYENMPRCLQDNQGLSIQKGSWQVPEIFNYLQNLASIEEDEMYHVFNMGVGFMLVVDEKDVDTCLEHFKDSRHTASIIGKVTDSKGLVWQ